MSVLVVQFLSIVNGALLFLVLVLLLRGPAKKFSFVLTYVAWECFATFALTFADRIYHGSAVSAGLPTNEATRIYAHFYWLNEVAVDLLRFLIVIVLTYTVTAQGPQRTAIGRLLGGVVLVAMVLPFLLFHPTFTPWPKGSWFSSTSELLNFAAAIMNLVLWGALVASRQRDPQLLTVSAGLGVLVTGSAIYNGMRHFIPIGPFRWIPDVFLMLTQLAGWTIWCHAFWPSKKPPPVRGDSVT